MRFGNYKRKTLCRLKSPNASDIILTLQEINHKVESPVLKIKKMKKYQIFLIYLSIICVNYNLLIAYILSLPKEGIITAFQNFFSNVWGYLLCFSFIVSIFIVYELKKISKKPKIEPENNFSFLFYLS